MIGFFIFLILFVVIFASIPVGISLFAYMSRKSHYKRLTASLPSDVIYTAQVRMNTPKKNAAFFKMKAFEFCGVLYVRDNTIYITGSKNQGFEFPLATTAITWPGVQVQNGALQWFCLDDMKGNQLYVNSDTGVFIFRTSSKMQSTQDIYQHLLKLQQIASIGGMAG